MSGVIGVENAFISSLCNRQKQVLSTHILEPVPHAFNWHVVCAFQGNKCGVAIDADLGCIGMPKSATNPLT